MNDLHRTVSLLRSLRCRECKGPNISLGVWLDSRNGDVSIGEPIHDVNPTEDWGDSLGLSNVQFCDDCTKHVGLIDVREDAP